MSDSAIELKSKGGSTERLPPIQQPNRAAMPSASRAKNSATDVKNAQWFSAKNPKDGRKTQNKASFIKADTDVMQKIRTIISKCKQEDNDGKNTIQQLEALIYEAKLRKDGFDCVFNTLQQLDNTEAKVLELLFFYKINDIEEFEREKNEIVKEYKMKLLT